MKFSVLSMIVIIWLGSVSCDQIIFKSFDSTELARIKPLGTMRELFFVPVAFEFNIADSMYATAEIRKKYLAILRGETCKDRPYCKKYCQREFEYVSDIARMINEFNKETELLVSPKGRHVKREIVLLVAAASLALSSLAYISKAESEENVKELVAVFNNRSGLNRESVNLLTENMEELFDKTAYLSQRIDKIENRNVVNEALMFMKDEMNKIHKKLLGLYAMMTTSQISMDYFSVQQLEAMMVNVSSKHLLVSTELNNLVRTSEVDVTYKALVIQVIVKVACAKADEFKLFEIIPLPRVNGSEITTLSLDFKYVAQKKSKFATTLHDLDNCISVPRNYFCKLGRKIVFLEKSNIEASCELQIFELERVSDKCKFAKSSLHGNELIEAETNKFIYLLMTNTSIRHGCGNESLEEATLTSHTSFNLPCNCSVELDDYILTPKDCSEGEFIHSMTRSIFEFEMGRTIEIKAITPRILIDNREISHKYSQIKDFEFKESILEGITNNISGLFNNVTNWISEKFMLSLPYILLIVLGIVLLFACVKIFIKSLLNFLFCRCLCR